MSTYRAFDESQRQALEAHARSLSAEPGEGFDEVQRAGEESDAAAEAEQQTRRARAGRRIGEEFRALEAGRGEDYMLPLPVMDDIAERICRAEGVDYVEPGSAYSVSTDHPKGSSRIRPFK